MSSYSRQALEKYLSFLEIDVDNVLDIGSSQQNIGKRLKSFNVEECIGLDLENPHEGEKADLVCDIQNVEEEWDRYKSCYPVIKETNNKGIKDSAMEEYGYKVYQERKGRSDHPYRLYQEEGLSKKQEARTVVKYLREYFDVAFCIEISEYWFNPLQALKNINYFLKKGGIAYISFHFVYMIHPPKGLDMLRYTPDGCEKILKETGFEIVEHIPRMANSNFLALYYGNDKMRGIKDGSVNHNVIGSIIKAKKI